MVVEALDEELLGAGEAIDAMIDVNPGDASTSIAQTTHFRFAPYFSDLLLDLLDPLVRSDRQRPWMPKPQPLLAEHSSASSYWHVDYD